MPVVYISNFFRDYYRRMIIATYKQKNNTIMATKDSYECVEKISLENLHRLIESPKVSEDHKLWLRKLQRKLRKETSHELIFQTTQRIAKFPAGRMYAKFNKPNLQECPRILRGALAPGYVEVDIVNCFPSLFLWLFKENDISFPAELQEYVDDRDAFVLRVGMDKAVVKNHVNSVMNFGQTLNPIILALGEHFQASFRALLDLPAFRKYLDFSKARNESRNPDDPYKTAVHFVGADIERKSILACMEQFRQNGFETSTVIHDGFLVRTEQDFTEFQTAVQPMLERAAAVIQRDIGYPIKLSVKQLEFNPEDIFDENTVAYSNDDLNDHMAAEIFVKFLTENHYHFRKSQNVLYMYDPNTHLWSDKICGWRNLAASCTELEIYGKSTVKQNNMWTQVIDGIRDEAELMVTFNEASYLKMAWENGYYDFAQKTFNPYDDDSYELGFFEKVKWSWNDNLDDELCFTILNVCIYGVFNEEQGRYLMKALGRAAAGYVADKLMYIILGNTNSGKGVLMTLLEKAFGKMVGTFNSGVLAHKVVQDEAKGLSFMVALKDKRFLLGSEASRACVFDSQKINMMASGGDTITARQNNKDETEFKMAGTAFLFCNDMSKINGLDDSVANRLRFIEPVYSFLSGEMYERKKAQFNVRRADDSIKTVFVKRDDVGATFAQMVCQSFTMDRAEEPVQVVQQNREWLDAEDISEALSKLFEPCEHNMVVFKDFFRACQEIESLRHVSANKISRTMHTSFNVRTKTIKPNGKTVKCFQNIRLFAVYSADNEF